MTARCYHCRGHEVVYVPSLVLVPKERNGVWRLEPLTYVRLPCICCLPFGSWFAPRIR